jgi:hypothetical protein
LSPKFALFSLAEAYRYNHKYDIAGSLCEWQQTKNQSLLASHASISQQNPLLLRPLSGSPQLSTRRLHAATLPVRIRKSKKHTTNAEANKNKQKATFCRDDCAINRMDKIRKA